MTQDGANAIEKATKRNESGKRCVGTTGGLRTNEQPYLSCPHSARKAHHLGKPSPLQDPPSAKKAERHSAGGGADEQRSPAITGEYRKPRSDLPAKERRSKAEETRRRANGAIPTAVEQVSANARFVSVQPPSRALRRLERQD